MSPGVGHLLDEMGPPGVRHALKVCVFASSRATTPESYKTAASRLGEVLAKEGHLCINGGGKLGCMGALNEGCRKYGGRIKTVIHQMWKVDKHEFTHSGEVVVATGNNLQERKRLLWEACDCVIALPGGTGTYDELFEVACEGTYEHQYHGHNAVGFGKIPLVVVNVDGFYDGIIAQMERATKDNMLYGSPFRVETDVIEALEWCKKEVSRLRSDRGSNAVVMEARGATFIFRRRHSFVMGVFVGALTTALAMTFPVVALTTRRKR